MVDAAVGWDMATLTASATTGLLMGGNFGLRSIGSMCSSARVSCGSGQNMIWSSPTVSMAASELAMHIVVMRSPSLGYSETWGSMNPASTATGVCCGVNMSGSIVGIGS